MFLLYIIKKTKKKVLIYLLATGYDDVALIYGFKLLRDL